VVGDTKQLIREWSTSGQAFGNKNIKVTIFLPGGTREVKQGEFQVVSDVTPEKWGVEIINVYNHEPTSYTQGLEFHNGFLYEGTGQEGYSKLVKLDPVNQNVLRELKLGNQYFGEGITIFGDKIYQLTYRSNTCFVYDKKSFKLLNQFQYQNEGWGLTHNDTSLIMSNGSNELTYRNPETFEVLKTISVADDKGIVEMLNELEYVDGDIYANIYDYGFQKIVVIDSSTGKVKADIDCSKLVSKLQSAGRLDVFNGIAYNPEKSTFLCNWKMVAKHL